MSKTVKILNPATKEILTIPAAELAPGMVEVDLIGVGRVWISAADVNLHGNFKQLPFNADIHPLLQHLKTALDEVYPKSLAEWEAIFRKDSNPGQEMSHWLTIADTYQQCTEGKTLSLKKRKEYLRLIISCSHSPREHVFQIYRPETLSRAEADQVVALYYS